MKRIGVIDYGAGNFSSVVNALAHIGVIPVPIRTSEDFERETHIILPGVGSFGGAMEKLTSLGLDILIKREVRDRHKPILGICVGMQVLATTGLEFGTHQGLDLVKGVVCKIPVKDLPIPQMGWNTLSIKQPSPLFADMPEDPSFYFVHSYHLETSPDQISATVDYGGDVTAVVSGKVEGQDSPNIFGVQFHPEKSQGEGMLLLRNFCQI